MGLVAIIAGSLYALLHYFWLRKLELKFEEKPEEEGTHTDTIRFFRLQLSIYIYTEYIFSLKTVLNTMDVDQNAVFQKHSYSREHIYGMWDVVFGWNKPAEPLLYSSFRRFVSKLFKTLSMEHCEPDVID